MMRPRSSMSSIATLMPPSAIPKTPPNPEGPRLVMTTSSGNIDANACPTGSVAHLPLPIARLHNISEAQVCIGHHARGEGHRSVQGLEWDASADEKRPAPPVEISIGFSDPIKHLPIPRARAQH